MYISKLTIKNFRNFVNTSVEFHEGINVIIGENNSGKSNLLKALGLIFNTSGSRKLEFDDFNKEIDTSKYFEKEDNELKIKHPPTITVTVDITQSLEGNEITPDDNNTVFTWRVQTSPHYIARLTYEFFLPEGEETRTYIYDIEQLIQRNTTASKHYWNLLKQRYIHRYVTRIYEGDINARNRVDNNKLKLFDYQFLDAIRDVEKELFTGKNTLLKEVLRFFLDFDLKNNTSLSSEDISTELEERHNNFSEKSTELIEKLKERIDTVPILKYSKDVGASIGGIPDFEGSTDEINMMSTLKLIVKKYTGIQLPATYNGLGYNNLLYISILLAKMQMSRSNHVSQDDRAVFPMLVIEEPEAHLHPSMQFKFLKFLKENITSQKQVRQSFITTHSTHITAAVELDEIICFNINQENKLCVAYPGKVFDVGNEKEQKSKAYVKRFLDATKSDMLFAKKIIFVEGIAEQLLIHTLAEYEGKSLADNHIAVINVNGRFFEHFLKMFDYDEADNCKKNALQRQVVCITDADPSRKQKNIENAKFKKCYPFDLYIDNNNYEYQALSTTLLHDLERYQDHSYIQILSRVDGRGKTFEYELAQNNPTLKLLLTEDLAKKAMLESISDAIDKGEELDNILTILNEEEIKDSIIASNWKVDEKKAACFAARYLKSIDNSRGKGEHALALDLKLRKNLEDGNPVNFQVPDYIKKAIDYLCD